MSQQHTQIRLLHTPLAKRVFSTRTRKLMEFDIRRLQARLKRYKHKAVMPLSTKLHLGSGKRRVAGWLNVDVLGSDFDIDFASGRLPWPSRVFDCVVSQHVIEHLDLNEEVVPLFGELRRVLKPGGEIWLSCPDIDKICRSYLERRMADLLEDRKPRWPSYSLEGMPPSQMINDLFHQRGEHKNLYDFELLAWALTTAGFVDVRQVVEADLLERFPEFPARQDDRQSLYVRAVTPA